MAKPKSVPVLMNCRLAKTPPSSSVSIPYECLSLECKSVASHLVGGKWYYLGSSGAMMKSKWVGNYWMGADGVMATNAWVDGGRYYVGSDGAWVKGKTR